MAPPIHGAARSTAPVRGQLEMGLGGNRGRGWPSLHVLCGALAAMWGAAIILAKVFTVGGWSIHHGDNQAYRAGMDFGVLLGVALVVAGSFHLRRGIRRYRDRPVGQVTARDRLRNLGLTVGLFAGVMLLAPLIPDPDGRFENPSAPYSYRYPGEWSQADPRLFSTSYPWLTNVSMIARSDDDAGVSVSTYRGDATGRLQDWMTGSVEDNGGRVVEVRTVTMAGGPAVLVAYDMPEGRHDGSMTVARRTGAAFLVWCQWENDSSSGREACAKVRDTLQIR